MDYSLDNDRVYDDKVLAISHHWEIVIKMTLWFLPKMSNPLLYQLLLLAKQLPHNVYVGKSDEFVHDYQNYCSFFVIKENWKCTLETLL